MLVGHGGEVREYNNTEVDTIISRDVNNQSKCRLVCYRSFSEPILKAVLWIRIRDLALF
jgi:hypothetical protein